MNTGVPSVIRVLAADDDLVFLGLVEKALPRHWQATTVSSSTEVLEALPGNFDLLILDLDFGSGLPSGLDILMELKGRQISLPVVILTGNDTAAAASGCWKAGISDYFVKPLLDREEEFRKTCQEAVWRWRNLQGRGIHGLVDEVLISVDSPLDMEPEFLHAVEEMVQSDDGKDVHGLVVGALAAGLAEGRLLAKHVRPRPTFESTARLGTLGPAQTNSELAILYYMRVHDIHTRPGLYATMEDAAKDLRAGKIDACVACSVYTKLYKLTFENVDALMIIDAFVFDTMAMMLAKRKEVGEIRTVVSHPSPVPLLDKYDYQITETTSNSVAASLCAEGQFDACMTTGGAAREFDLEVVHDFGPISMSWTVYGLRSRFESKEKDA